MGEETGREEVSWDNVYRKRGRKRVNSRSMGGMVIFIKRQRKTTTSII